MEDAARVFRGGVPLLAPLTIHRLIAVGGDEQRERPLSDPDGALRIPLTGPEDILPGLRARGMVGRNSVDKPRASGQE
jgi:hypothetical protein